MSDVMPPTVSLDHLIGQQVTQVFPGDDSSAYTLQMDSGIVITNKDTSADPPDSSIVGDVLCSVDYGDGTATTLQFGLTSTDGVIEELLITLDPTKYTLGGIEGQEEEYYPQVPQDVADALPPDPSDDRVVDGPET